MIRISPQGSSAKIRITPFLIAEDGTLKKVDEFEVEGSIWSNFRSNETPKCEISIAVPLKPIPNCVDDYETIRIDLVKSELISPLNRGFSLDSLQVLKKEDESKGIIIGFLHRVNENDLIDAEYKLVGLMPRICTGVNYYTIPNLN